jgi:hypothetical protein
MLKLKLGQNHYMSYIFTRYTLILSIFFLLFVQVGYGQTATKTWDGGAGTTSWGDAANWSPDGVPTSSDHIVISEHVSVDLPNDFTAYCASLKLTPSNNSTVKLQVRSRSTLLIAGNLEATPAQEDVINEELAGKATITSTGNISIDGDLILTGNSSPQSIEILFNSGNNASFNPVINIQGNLSANQYCTITSGTNSTLNLNGANSSTLSGEQGLSYRNITVNKSSSSSSVTISGSVSNLSVQGNVNITSGILNDGGKIIEGQVDSIFTVNDGATFASTGTGSLPTNFTLDFKPESVIEFAAAGDQSVPDRNDYKHIAFSGGGTKTLGGALVDIKSINIKFSTTLNSNNYDVSLLGNWINDGSFTPGTGTVTLKGTTAQQIGGSQTLSFNNLTVNKTGTATLTGNATVAGVLDISNGILNSGTNSVTGTGYLAMSGGELQLGTPSVTVPELNLSTLSGGKISITGTGAQIKAATYRNLNVTGSEVQLAGAVTVSDSMELGTIINNGGYTFTVGTSATSLGSLIVNSGFFYGGPLTRWYSADANGAFPLGTADGLSRSLNVTGAAGTTGTITATHTAGENSRAVDLTDTDGTPIKVVSNSSWTVSTGDNLSGTGFSISMGGSGLGKVDSLAHIRLVAVTGGTPAIVGAHADATGDTITPYGTRTGLAVEAQQGASLSDGSLSEFATLATSDLNNEFTIASTDETDSPLPIRLIYFKAEPKDTAVELSWATATERDNLLFEVERSRDGSDFKVIASQDGALNSDQVLYYTDTDNAPLAGRNVYRLKQTDLDGKFTYSDEVKVYFSNVNASMLIYPNPTNRSNTKALFKGVEGNVYIKLMDAAGRLVINNTIVSNFEEQTVELPTASLKPGIYFLNVVSEAANFKEKIIVY